jgi:hypothetical protein
MHRALRHQASHLKFSPRLTGTDMPDELSKLTVTQVDTSTKLVSWF